VTDGEITNLFKEYLDERFRRTEDRLKALQQLFDQRATAGDRALELAKVSLNEMREMANDQAATFMHRLEFEAKHAIVISKLEALSDRINTITGVSTGSDKTWYVIGIVLSVAAALMAAIIALHK